MARRQGHPQRLNLLAHHVWGLVGDVASASSDDWLAALQSCLAHARPESDAIWTTLNASQRKVLRLVSWGEPLAGSAAGRLGLIGGSVAAARTALVRSGVLDEHRRLVDPLLGIWLRRAYPSP
ncbi:MAG TPA: hypothetical protein VHM89_04210 [Acidimicrobiales bacterium]|nr:hypothetical protein [Acidimicrobiales bacterium]